jgi:hypothetical protein
MSHLFQRPLCDMGRAYEYAYRPILGEAEETVGGGCDDRPHRVELFAADADAKAPSAGWRSFALCPEHEDQLAGFDLRLAERGTPSRFRTPRPTRSS